MREETNIFYLPLNLKQEFRIDGFKKGKNRLFQVKIAVLYENVTDGVLIGRSIEETIDILKYRPSSDLE